MIDGEVLFLDGCNGGFKLVMMPRNEIYGGDEESVMVATVYRCR